VELAEIEAAFAQIPDTELSDARENAMAGDMLDELESWSTTDYENKVKVVRDAYEDRIVKILNRVRYELINAGYECGELSESSCDDYRWNFVCYPRGTRAADCDELPDDAIDVTLQIAESQQYEGTDDGINFMIDVVEVGGTIVGGMAPGNYTSECWVSLNDPAAVAARFALFERASDNRRDLDIVRLINDR
jgi:hypothetical protein